MDTQLKVNVENRTATLWLDWFFIEVQKKEDVGFIVSRLTEIDNSGNMSYEIIGNKINIKYNYDFGEFIPDNIWEFGERLLPDDMRSQAVKELVLECVKELIPGVMNVFRESAVKFSKTIKD